MRSTIAATDLAALKVTAMSTSNDVNGCADDGESAEVDAIVGDAAFHSLDTLDICRHPESATSATGVDEAEAAVRRLVDAARRENDAGDAGDDDAGDAG